MINSFGRSLHKLRVQLLDACNMRCSYCMPDNPKFLPSKDLIKIDELLDICSKLIKRGVDEIRLTGGEPLMRKDFIEIVKGLSKYPLKKLGVTTNAMLLNKEILFELSKTNLKYINISLDSLNSERFKDITKRDVWQDVYNNILLAQEMGFEVKVNTVIMKDFNGDEILDFITFAEKTGVNVRFLELMRVGPNNINLSDQIVTMNEIIDKISVIHSLQKCEVPEGNTAQEFRTLSGAHIGFIASETQSFCSSCSRLRLTAKGELRSCLFREEAVSLIGLNDDDFNFAVDAIAKKKPLERIESIQQSMNVIGG
jgi:GTP 3',8-cyclase